MKNGSSLFRRTHTDDCTEQRGVQQPVCFEYFSSAYDPASEPYGVASGGDAVFESILTHDEVLMRMKKHHLGSSIEMFEKCPASAVGKDSDVVEMDLARFVNTDFSWKGVSGRFVKVHNPLNHFSVLQPLAGCDHGRYTVKETANAADCVFAVNAGFFDTSNGRCLGNIISNGKIVKNGGRQNVNFGVTKSGEFVTGYLSSEDIETAVAGMNITSPFEQLVSGVIWLVRNGTKYVDVSASVEDLSIQETGSAFITVQSARVAVGHNAEGNLIILQVDGKSWERGVNLYSMADMMISLGAVNAINLDGGGSATAVLNDSTISMPSDSCPIDVAGGLGSVCARPVTSILCVHNVDRRLSFDAGDNYNEHELSETKATLWRMTVATIVCVACIAILLLVGVGVAVHLYLRRVNRKKRVAVVKENRKKRKMMKKEERKKVRKEKLEEKKKKRKKRIEMKRKGFDPLKQDGEGDGEGEEKEEKEEGEISHHTHHQDVSGEEGIELINIEDVESQVDNQQNVDIDESMNRPLLT